VVGCPFDRKNFVVVPHNRFLQQLPPRPGRGSPAPIFAKQHTGHFDKPANSASRPFGFDDFQPEARRPCWWRLDRWLGAFVLRSTRLARLTSPRNPRKSNRKRSASRSVAFGGVARSGWPSNGRAAHLGMLVPLSTQRIECSGAPQRSVPVLPLLQWILGPWKLRQNGRLQHLGHDLLRLWRPALHHCKEHFALFLIGPGGPPRGATSSCVRVRPVERKKPSVLVRARRFWALVPARGRAGGQQFRQARVS